MFLMFLMKAERTANKKLMKIFSFVENILKSMYDNVCEKGEKL